jgi:hypothetical protein
VLVTKLEMQVKQEGSQQDGKSVVIGQVYRPVPPEYLPDITRKNPDVDRVPETRNVIDSSDQGEQPSHQFTTSRLYGLPNSV